MIVNENYNKQYYLDNKEKFKQYSLDNKEEIAEKKRQYYLDNKEKFKQRYMDNKDRLSKLSKQYSLNNKDKINKYYREYNKKRRNTEPLFKLTVTLRNRVNIAIKKKFWNKKNSTADILGCDCLTIKKYIESKFTDGMNWSNHGEWHIDHIYPLSKAKDENELYKLCHYTNLQPLWAKDNLSKGGKII